MSWLDTFGRLGIDVSLADGLMGVARSAGWWWTLRDAVILTERPLALHRDDRHRLHSGIGPAIAYPDGFGVWAWHGTRVPADVIYRPEMITAARIRGERNVEIRRVMIERVGAERYLSMAKAKLVAKDDYGELWSAPRTGDSPLLLVKVVNSTPEPDGSFHDYYLRVPGTTEQPERRCVSCGADIARVPETARAAVAWTFRACAEHYRPAVQT